MFTEVREHEERSRSARYLILIFLVCVATCGVFFSLGFLVGYNERSSHSAPATEVVTAPPVIPPTVNPPAEGAPATSQEAASSHAAANPAPETEVIPSGGAGTSPASAAAKPGEGSPPPPPASKPAPSSASLPVPVAGDVAQGITLQVVASRSKQDAEHVVDILKEKGYPVFLVTPEYAHADDNFFRVQVGPFRTRADADKVHDKLVQEGFKPFIKR